MDGDDISARLLAEYGASIDTSTVLAILSDYDLSDSSQVTAAKQTLDMLLESLPAEEQSGFDPSAAARDGAEKDSVSTRSALGWTHSASTADTEISQDVLNDLEGISFDAPLSSRSGTSSGQETPATQDSYLSGLDALDDAGKEKVLLGIFPTLKEFDVKWTLKKCNYDAVVVIDELMTQSFLEESGGRQKGIDAFSEAARPVKSKKKGRKKGKGGDPTRAEKDAAQVEDDQAQSQWERGRQDVEFLSRKTGIPMQQVGSLYHAQGASVKSTIRAIVKAHLDVGLEDEDDAVLQLNAHQLKPDFPSLQLSEIEALIQITQPSLNNAKDLAKVLSAQESTGKKGGIKIEFRHAPPDLSTDSSRSPLTPIKSSNVILAHLDHHDASMQAQSLFSARQAAYHQASSAYRKSKSDHLYGGAASYYSQVARDLSDRAKSMESAAADTLVSQQSSRTELDLHGVNVKDAVRISREKVTEWWVRECEERARNGRGGGGGTEQGGYRIVTGVGRHSEGGRAKLGPAVGAMLIREGWKVEVGSGAIVVRGVTKK